MQQTVVMTGEELAQVLAGAMEYNGLVPTGVRIFGTIRDAGTGEVNLTRAEIACDGFALKVRTKPEDEYRRVWEAQHARLLDNIKRTLQPEPPTVAPPESPTGG